MRQFFYMTSQTEREQYIMHQNVKLEGTHKVQTHAILLLT